MKRMLLVASPMIVKPLSGGCINKVYLVKQDSGYAVLKENDSVPADFFAAEEHGLHCLAQHGLPVPKVIQSKPKQIYLEYLEPGKHEFEKAGRELALLHLQSQPEFGLSRNNYIGSLIQQNSLEKDWLSFWRNFRIKPMLELLDNPDKKLWDSYLLDLPRWLGSEFHSSPLHGDLWGGNLHFSGGKAFFIDPAFYYGDAMVDLAMTQLFGGFPTNFYDSYKETGGEFIAEKISHYQVYPILVHAVLFGGAYYQQALGIIKRFLS